MAAGGAGPYPAARAAVGIVPLRPSWSSSWFLAEIPAWSGVRGELAGSGEDEMGVFNPSLLSASAPRTEGGEGPPGAPQIPTLIP